ncbi:hypothetical protein CAAN1_17S01706 [[Candida] anglica]|uniref:BRCT domain-containing protein n=1 Tax=[Candida] anglica TaxID=148631 RepID=A0ABP0E7I2_9ASCO
MGRKSRYQQSCGKNQKFESQGKSRVKIHIDRHPEPMEVGQIVDDTLDKRGVRRAELGGVPGGHGGDNGAGVGGSGNNNNNNAHELDNSLELFTQRTSEEEREGEGRGVEMSPPRAVLNSFCSDLSHSLQFHEDDTLELEVEDSDNRRMTTRLRERERERQARQASQSGGFQATQVLSGIDEREIPQVGATAAGAGSQGQSEVQTQVGDTQVIVQTVGHTVGYMTENGDTQRIQNGDTQVVEKEDTMVGGTQVIRPMVRGGELDDTQVIGSSPEVAMAQRRSDSAGSSGQYSRVGMKSVNNAEGEGLLGHVEYVSNQVGDTQVVSNQVENTQIVPGRVQDTQEVLNQVEDTQVVPGRLQDTQVVPGPVQETQRVPQVTQDTQRVPQLTQDTQLVPNGMEMPPPLSQSSPSKVDSREKNGQSSSQQSSSQQSSSQQSSSQQSSSQKKHSSSPAYNSPAYPLLHTSNTHLSKQSSAIGSEILSPAKASTSIVQIPNTVERTMAIDSMAQVQNTQEDLIDATFQLDDLGTRPVYSSSQKLTAEEINTDEEINEEEEERAMEESESEDERIKVGHDSVMYSDDRKFGHNSVMYSDETMMTTNNTMAASRIDESSPAIKGADMLKLPSSPKQSDRSEEEEEEEEEIITRRSKRKLAVLEESQSQSETQARSKIPALANSQTQTEAQPNTHSQAGSLLREESSLSSGVTNSRSVWAEYKFKMYPGTVLEAYPEYSVVSFEDGLTNVNNADLKPLDIRIGDKVRVGTYQYVVTGLQRGPSESDLLESKSSGSGSLESRSSAEGLPIMCTRGYSRVWGKRISKNKQFEETSFPLSQCYMEIEDWMEHQQRFDLLDSEFARSRQIGASGVFSDGVSPRKAKLISGTMTPSVPTTPVPQREITTTGTGVFSQTVFCLTNLENRQQLSSIIQKNGGTLLDGIDEVVEYSETKQGLRLKSSVLARFKFAALISNSHCRSAKYLQALAMGWPVLADSFVHDCVRDHATMHSWYVYLLPSGYSHQLGCIRSSDVFKFRANLDDHKPLTEQLANNCNVLSRFDIVVINNKLNSKNLQTCEFIFHAVGANSIQYLKEISEIGQLADKSWTNVLLYDNTPRPGQEAAVARPTPRPMAKPTRSSARSSARARTRKTKPRQTVAIIDWEWVVQCVINGHAWEPKYIEI